VLAAWLRNRKLKVDLHEHRMAADLCKLKKLHPNREFPGMESIMSPHQLHVTGTFGEISVVRGGLSFGDFEIYSLDGDLFAGIRRYRDVEHAGKTIYALLTTGMFDEGVPRVFFPLEDLFGNNSGPDGSVQDVME
ncbi:hypothetical protein LCGC14_2739580, partial [marine sediment metagenome]